MTSRFGALVFFAVLGLAACPESVAESETCTDASAVRFSTSVGTDGNYSILVAHDGTTAQCDLSIRGGVVLRETVRCSANDLGPIFMAAASTDGAAVSQTPGPLTGVAWAGLSTSAQVTVARDGTTVVVTTAVLAPATSLNACLLNAATITVETDGGTPEGGA